MIAELRPKPLIHTGEVECAAAEVGYDASRLEAVNEFFARMIESEIIFGVAYRLARRGKIFAAASIGARHFAKPELTMRPDNFFGLASQTKQFAAVAMLILHENGLVSVDDTVAKYLPQFDGAPYDEITITHLLTHTSGLYPEGSIPDKHHADAFEHIRRQYEIDGNETDWITAGLRGGMRRKPGAEWQYCSFGIMVLAAIVQKVTGEKYENFVREKILLPLGMKNTTYRPTPEQIGGAVIFNAHDEDWYKDIQTGKKSEGMWDIFPAASSGYFSTTEDMIKFGMMLAGRGRLGNVRILGRKTVELLATNRLFGVPDNCWGASEKDRKHGLGFDMRRFPGTLYSPGTFLHEGAGHSVLIFDPAEEMVCSCCYPWVNSNWNADCNGRLYNVMWSGLV